MISQTVQTLGKELPPPQFELQEVKQATNSSSGNTGPSDSGVLAQSPKILDIWNTETQKWDKNATNATNFVFPLTEIT